MIRSCTNRCKSGEEESSREEKRKERMRGIDGEGDEKESRAVDSIHARGGRRGYKVRRDKHRRINYA